MHTTNQRAQSDRYARCVRASKSVRWDIDGLSLVPESTTLARDERRFVSQIQGRRIQAALAAWQCRRAGGER